MYIEKIQSKDIVQNIISKYENASIENNSVKVYRETETEYITLKYGAGIYIDYFPVIIKMEGNDVLDYLHRVSTNSIKELTPGEIAQTLFLNEKGRLIDRTTILNLENQVLLVGQNNVDWLLNWVNKYIITEDIKTSTITNYALLTIIGPQTESFLTITLGDELKNITSNKFIQTSIDGFNFTVYVQMERGNIKHYKLLIEKDFLNSFVDYLINNKSVFDVNLVGEDAYSLYRIKNGIVDENEINHNYNPHEVGLLDEISFNKGCYIGQEVIARLDTYDKVQRKMYGIVSEEKIETSESVKIFNNNNEEVGIVTTIAFSEKDNKTIGLALIRIKSFSLDSEFFLSIDNQRIKINIIELPFTK